MPKRVREHELEGESIRCFEDSLGPKWLYRPKTLDYGIDGEVEVFDLDGSATGLTFNVQIRGTDSASRAQEVRLDVNALDYYRSFDVPTAVIRYGSTNRSIFWQWASNIGSKSKIKDNQKTLTYRFNEHERWTNATPAIIRRTLEVRRRLETFPANKAVPIRVDLSAMPSTGRYQLDRTIADIISTSRDALVRAGGEVANLEVEIRVEPAFLAVGIDTLTGVTFDLPDATQEEYATAILYALGRLFFRQRLQRQAESVALLILNRNLADKSGGLASDVCLALSGRLLDMVRLAIVNGLHKGGPEQAVIARTIAKSSQNDETRRAAMDLFFEASLADAQGSGATSEAAAHYSIGNAYRADSLFSAAIKHFNRARHLRPAYLQTDYFVRELASVLFLSGHFKPAARCYREAAKLSPSDADIEFLLGDALLLSGEIAEAQRLYVATLANCSAARMLREAELKVWVCNRMLIAHPAGTAPRRRAEANRLIGPDGGEDANELEKILASIDSFHPLAHFNLGVMLAGVAAHNEALFHFLACAIIQPQDTEAWTNSAMCALNLHDELMLGSILCTAIHHMGADAYDQFRSHVASSGMSDEALALFDGLAMEWLEQSETARDGEFKIRMLDGDGYQEMTII